MMSPLLREMCFGEMRDAVPGCERYLSIRARHRPLPYTPPSIALAKASFSFSSPLVSSRLL